MAEAVHLAMPVQTEATGVEGQYQSSVMQPAAQAQAAASQPYAESANDASIKKGVQEDPNVVAGMPQQPDQMMM